MGNHAQAMLFYGFELGSEGKGWVPPWQDIGEGGWGDLYLYKMGKDDLTSYEPEGEAVIDACPCEIDYHNNIDEAVWFVTVRGVGLRAYEGTAEEVCYNPDIDYDTQIKDFCILMGLEYKQPRWYLAAYYG